VQLGALEQFAELMTTMMALITCFVASTLPLPADKLLETKLAKLELFLATAVTATCAVAVEFANSES